MDQKNILVSAGRYDNAIINFIDGIIQKQTPNFRYAPPEIILTMWESPILEDIRFFQLIRFSGVYFSKNLRQTGTL